MSKLWKLPMSLILTLIVAVLVIFLCNQNVAAENLKSNVFSKKQSYIVDIALCSLNIPVLLDNTGHVWVFKKPFSRKGLIKLPNLKDITKIASFMALDKNGRVFTWSLDKKTDMTGPDDDDFNAIYTTPAMMQGLDNITMIAYGGDRLVAVRDNREIIEWFEIQSSEEGYGIKGYTPLKTLYTAPEAIKSIDIGWNNTLALLKDGTILGWGVNKSGRTKKALAGKQVSFSVSSPASAVYLNGFHVVVLLEDGRTIFWGECGYDDDRLNEQLGINAGDGLVSGVEGPIKDVKAMAMPGNDNARTNVFLKKDGTVWLAYAPVPPDINKLYCGKGGSLRKFWQLTGMTIPAKVVKMGKDSILVLGADHSVWEAENRSSKYPAELKLRKIHIKTEE